MTGGQGEAPGKANAGEEIYEGHPAPGGFGTIPLSEVARVGGLQALRGSIDGTYPAPPIARAMRFWLRTADEGRVVFEGSPTEAYLNPLGGLHGGWTATIMDSALACAVMTTLQPGEGYTTVEFKVNLTRPVRADGTVVRCEGRVLTRGRTIATSEATLLDGTGKVLAHGTETCVIFPIENLAPRGP